MDLNWKLAASTFEDIGIMAFQIVELNKSHITEALDVI